MVKHKITLEDIEKQTLTMLIASESGAYGKKDLYLIMQNGYIFYRVRHFVYGELKNINNHLLSLNTAVRKYNEI